jgi:hypothetical protein
VSRLFPERVTAGLAPAAVTVGARTIDCDPAFGAAPWDGAIAALRAIEWKERCRVSVVLSNHFVRYALVPWNEALGDPAEEEAYVRHHFARIHGERAKSWALRWSTERAGAPRLASAIDRALLDAVKQSCGAGGKARLVSIQPALMAAANAARRAVPASGAWLVCGDAERACVALHAQGAWRSVQNAKGAWLTALEREWLRHAPNAPRLALLVGSAGTQPAHFSERDRAASPNSGWTFLELAA